MEKCAAAMRRLPDVPYVLSFAVVSDGETAAGRDGRADDGAAARRLPAAGRLGHELRQRARRLASARSSGPCV